MDLLGPSPTVGVDLGRRSIKIVAVRSGKPPRLIRAAIQPTPDGAIDGGTIHNAPLLAQALRAGLRGAGIRGGRAVLGLSGRTALVRTVTLPHMPLDELKSAVRWEAERHLPLRLEEAVLDAQVTREVTEDGQRRLEVLMAAVPERDALLYYQVARDAGLDVAALEVTSLALARTLADVPGVTAAVDVGADVTEIVIAHPTLPPVCRSLAVGSDHFRPRPGEAAREADAAAPPGLQDLLDGLSRSIDYFQAQMRRERIQRVILTGDGVDVPGIAEALSSELGVPVAAGDPLSRLAAPAVPGDVQDRRASLAVAIGLALRTLH